MAVPTQIKHADYLAAVQPLLDLLGVSAHEIHNDIHLLGGGRAAPLLGRITFNYVARADGDEGARPKGQHGVVGLSAAPHDHSELAWPVSVEIV